MSLLCSLPLIAALAGCGAEAPLATGYVEGEYVLIAPVAVARIETLHARAGDRVETGAPLVTLENTDAEAALRQAEAAVAQAENRLANLSQGGREEEIRVLEAALAAARAQADEAARTARRAADLNRQGVAATAQREEAETRLATAQAQVAQAEANLAVARLPARPQEIAAAEAAVAEVRAARDAARWQLDQRKLAAPAAGRVHDVLRHPGEIAGPSAPVMTFLPDGAVVLRVWLPAAELPGVATGGRIGVACDGCPAGLTAKVTHVSDSPEFTPPVIYSLESRQKLSWLVEARPEGEAAKALRPGQIVDVRLLP